MKKRFLAITLTLVMALALAVPGFAATMPTTRLNHDWHDQFVIDDPDPTVHQNLNNSSQLVKVSHNNGTLFGYVNAAGQQIVQMKYTNIGNFTAEGLAWAVKDGVGVYVNTAGVEVISVGVATPHEFSNGLARVEDHHGNTYFIDTTGKIVFNLGQNKAGDFNEFGLTWVYNPSSGKYGIINKQGQEVSHFHYDNFSTYGDAHEMDVSYTTNFNVTKVLRDKLYYNSNLLRAERDGNVVFIDPYGAEHIYWLDSVNLRFDDFSNNMCLVKDKRTNQVGYMDISGFLAAYCEYEDGDPFTSLGVARIKRNGKYGYIDRVNKYTVQPEYDYLAGSPDSNGLDVAAKNKVVATAEGGTYFYVQSDGHVVARTEAGSAATALQFGFVNVLTGMEQIALNYDYARPFSEGLAYVSKWSLKGYVDTAGNIVMSSAWYDELGDFHSGLAWATKNDKYGYINKTGALAITANFDVDRRGDGYRVLYPYTQAYAPFDFRSNIAVARLSDFTGAYTHDTINSTSRYGIINMAGQYIYAPTFTEVLFFRPDWNDNIALFQEGGLNNVIVTLIH